MANPNKVLANNPFDAPTYTYPLDLGSVGQEPYIIFQIRDSVAKGAASKGTVALYMPPDLQVEYKAMYENFEMPIDQARAYTKMLATKGENNGWVDAAKGALGDAARAGAAGVIDQMSSSNAQAYNERYNGRIVNPHMAVLFKGIEPRTFSFKFNMFAKNREESEQIRNIIHVFKYAMHPSTQEPGDSLSKRYFFYPENFVIGLFSPEDRYLFKISTCALESMNVDYAGSAVPSFFSETGAPVHISMSLAFKELEVMTKSRISTGF